MPPEPVRAPNAVVRKRRLSPLGPRVDRANRSSWPDPLRAGATRGIGGAHVSRNRQHDLKSNIQVGSERPPGWVRISRRIYPPPGGPHLPPHLPAARPRAGDQAPKPKEIRTGRRRARTHKVPSRARPDRHSSSMCPPRRAIANYRRGTKRPVPNCGTCEFRWNFY